MLVYTLYSLNDLSEIELVESLTENIFFLSRHYFGEVLIPFSSPTTK